GFLGGQGRGGLDLADGRVHRAAFGREREQGDAWPGADDLAREPGGGNRNVRKLIHGGFRNDAAISHEQQAAFAEAGVLDFHDHATGGGGGGGSHFGDLKERAQHTAGDMAGAGNETIGLVHR